MTRLEGLKFLQFLHVNSGPSDPGSFERHSFCGSAFLSMRFVKKMAQVNEEHVEKRTSTWQWNHRMTEHLIAKLREYKNEMGYQNIDFNKDVVTMQSQLRERTDSFV